MKREPPELANSVLYKVQSTIMYQQQPPVKIVVAFDDIAGHKGCKSATNSERQYYYVLSTSPTSAVAEAVNTASRVVNINMKARAREELHSPIIKEHQNNSECSFQVRIRSPSPLYF